MVSSFYLFLSVHWVSYLSELDQVRGTDPALIDQHLERSGIVFDTDYGNSNKIDNKNLKNNAYFVLLV